MNLCLNLKTKLGLVVNTVITSRRIECNSRSNDYNYYGSQLSAEFKSLHSEMLSNISFKIPSILSFGIVPA